MQELRPRAKASELYSALRGPRRRWPQGEHRIARSREPAVLRSGRHAAAAASAPAVAVGGAEGGSGACMGCSLQLSLPPLWRARPSPERALLGSCDRVSAADSRFGRELKLKRSRALNARARNKHCGPRHRRCVDAPCGCIPGRLSKRQAAATTSRAARAFFLCAARRHP